MGARRTAVLMRLGLLAVAMSMVLVACEIALRIFAPVHVSTIGHRRAANAKLYGWGYDPYELIRLRDPDSNELYIDRANNHGWRDLDRDYDKPPGTYRILALGDSNTFGVIVARQDTWTQVLESLLREAGLRAEVLNLSYPGTGTDQQLEVLLHEGLRYQPDLIISQFTINDLSDNTYFDSGDKTLKPFYYTLSERGELIRHDNPHFGSAAVDASWRDTMHAVISTSEILKRAFILYEKTRYFSRNPYRVSPTRLAQVRTVLDLPAEHPVLAALGAHEGDDITQQEIDELVVRHYGGNSIDVFERLLENQPFQDSWFVEQYRPVAPRGDSYDWRLYLALLGRIAEQAEKAGAAMAILSDIDEGFYQWERFWYRIAPDPRYRQPYLGANHILQDFAEKHGVDLIASPHPHTRARNDSHPNAEGSRAMALNVFEYLRAARPPRLFGVDGHHLGQED